MNKDILYNIMIQSDVCDIEKLSLINVNAQKIKNTQQC